MSAAKAVLERSGMVRRPSELAANLPIDAAGSRHLPAFDDIRLGGAPRHVRARRAELHVRAPRPLQKSSTQTILELTLQHFKEEQVASEIIRVADLDIKSGVTSDEGSGR